MALQGSFWVTLTGWLFGIVFLEKPWGYPSLPSLHSPSLFLALINFSMLLILSLDAMKNFKEEILIPFTAGREGILTVVIRVSFVEVVTSNLLIRLVFIFQAKNLAKLWGKLYAKNYEDAKQTKFFKRVCANTTVVLVSFVLNLTLAVLDGMPIGKHFYKSWLAPIGHVPFSLLLAFFMIVPFVLPAACGFATVIGTLHHLRWAYKKYCKKIQALMKQKQFAAEIDKKHQQSCVLTAESKKKLVEEFEEIQNLFELWDISMGPILFVILVGGSLRLVASASKIFLKNKDGFTDLVLIKDVGHLTICACQLYVLEVGQTMIIMFQNWRDKLRKEYILLKTCYNDKKRKEIEDLKDLYLMIDNWRWNVSASRFFDVDRRLAAGIISYMVTYVIILVQVKISTEDI